MYVGKKKRLFSFQNEFSCIFWWLGGWKYFRLEFFFWVKNCQGQVTRNNFFRPYEWTHSCNSLWVYSIPIILLEMTKEYKSFILSQNIWRWSVCLVLIRTGIDLVFLGLRLASLLLWYRSQFQALASFWKLLGFIYILYIIIIHYLHLLQ